MHSAAEQRRSARAAQGPVRAHPGASQCASSANGGRLRGGDKEKEQGEVKRMEMDNVIAPNLARDVIIMYCGLALIQLKIAKSIKFKNVLSKRRIALIAL